MEVNMNLGDSDEFTVEDGSVLDRLGADEKLRSRLWSLLDHMTFYDPVSNSALMNPWQRCLPAASGSLSHPPPKLRKANVLEHISITGSICGPGNREGELFCPSPSAILSLAAFVAFAVVCAFALNRFTKNIYAIQSKRLERNAIAYAVNLVITSISLILVLSFGGPLIVHGEEIGDTAQRMVWLGGFVLIWLLYMWELVYRINMDPSLLLHHLCTLTLCVLMAVSLYDMEREILDNLRDVMDMHGRNVDRADMESAEDELETRIRSWLVVFRLGLLCMLTASTEQPSFVALLLHRASHPRAAAAFKLAWVWSAITKTALLVFGMVIYGLDGYSASVSRHCSSITWCTPWRVMYPVLYSLLYFSQLWATYVLRALSLRAGTGREQKDLER